MYEVSRRTFLQAAVAGAATAMVPDAAQAGQFTGKIKKAVKYDMIAGDASPVDKLKLLKDLGFDGVEPQTSLHRPGRVDVKALARASEKVELPVHGVVNATNADLRGAIDEARIYGANSVLTTLPRMPKGSYREHYKRTQQAIREAAEYAERQNVSILIENVWDSFLIEPLTMARFVDEIGSRFVQVYFDIGNVVRWGWPQNWIEVLGKRIVKLDVKEFDLDVAMNAGMKKAFDVPIGSGSIDWSAVRAALANLDYQGWATAEVSGGGAQRLAAIAEQMDRVLDL